MSIFDEIKSRADMRSVALQYGFTPNRSGFICCPFHSEKTPSLKLYDKSFYCYGCGIGGDAVRFVMKLYDLSAIEAAKKLNTDFALGIDISGNKYIKPREKTVTQSQMMSYFEEWQKYAFRVLNGYCKLLKLWYSEFAPKTPNDTPYPLWVRACRELPLTDHYCMVLIQGSDDERKSFYVNHRGEVKKIADEYRKYIGE